MKFLERWLARRAEKRRERERLLHVVRRAGISYRKPTAEEEMRWA
jgi:hypothetical protein